MPNDAPRGKPPPPPGGAGTSSPPPERKMPSLWWALVALVSPMLVNIIVLVWIGDNARGCGFLRVPLVSVCTA
jgi:hypothetical protein